MPEPLRRLQAQLLRHAGGDRVMAQVLAAVPIHGLEAVLVATELVLEAGRPSAEHVLNVLARLKPRPSRPRRVAARPRLKEEPRADVTRYDGLRGVTGRPPMSNDIVAQLRQLKLYGMAANYPEVVAAARHTEFEPQAFVHQLVKAEIAEREVRSIAYQMGAAKFPGASRPGRVRVRPGQGR